MSKKPIIQVKDVSQTFVVGENSIPVLYNINLDINEGDFVVIYGPSGCGKSTLLNILNGWIAPTEGSVNFYGEDIYKKDEDDRARMKQGTVALVHQSSSWVKSISVLENISIPFILAGKGKKEAKHRGEILLKLLKLEKYGHYKPMDLSGGQQQRISFLRSLIDNPSIIMADEPTGNLDTSSSHVLMDLFCKINTDLKRTVVMVTHNLDLLKHASKKVNIIDGKIVDIGINKDHKVRVEPQFKDVLDLARQSSERKTNNET